MQHQALHIVSITTTYQPGTGVAHANGHACRVHDTGGLLGVEQSPECAHQHNIKVISNRVLLWVTLRRKCNVWSMQTVSLFVGASGGQWQVTLCRDASSTLLCLSSCLLGICPPLPHRLGQPLNIQLQSAHQDLLIGLDTF